MSSEDIIEWPCGTWCYRDELHEYTYMSDDYMVHSYDSYNWHTFFEALDKWGSL
jgi:hypothetical protein